MVLQAQKKGLLAIDLVDLRSFTQDKHRTIDDAPYGGGPGMVLKPEPVYQAIRQVRRTHDACVIYLSPKGRPLTSRQIKELQVHDALAIVCGHYEGLDQRIVDHYVDVELSIGDYVLTGGEIAALVFIDAYIRFIPGVLGNESSLDRESFEQGLLDHPHYTRPAEFMGHKVPEVLLSGNHKDIDSWRHREAVRLTRERRPDLLEK